MIAAGQGRIRFVGNLFRQTLRKTQDGGWRGTGDGRAKTCWLTEWGLPVSCGRSCPVVDDKRTAIFTELRNGFRQKAQAGSVDRHPDEGLCQHGHHAGRIESVAELTKPDFRINACRTDW